MRTTCPRSSWDDRRIFAVLLTFCVPVFLTQTSAHAGANPYATFVLHAQPGLGGNCTASPTPDCGTVQPTVTVQPNSPYQVFLYLNNVNGVTGVQTAFIWDAGWDLLGSTWNCQTGQLTATTPDQNSATGGATVGTLTTAFNCVTSPSLIPIGSMLFLSGPSGCLSQVQSSYPNGNHVLDCKYTIDQADPSNDMHTRRFGKICVGGGGHNACPPVPQPVTMPEEEKKLKGENIPTIPPLQGAGVGVCSGPDLGHGSGVYLPRIDPYPQIPECSGIEPRESDPRRIIYVCIGPSGPIDSLPMEVRVDTRTLSGYHPHSQPQRPAPNPALVQGNTGADGLQFRVRHIWPEDAREHDVFVYSLDPQRPCGSQTFPLHDYCVRENVFTELPDNGVQYLKVGNPLSHPDRFYGTTLLVVSLQGVANDYWTAHPAGPKVSYNDMSLPWGGVFDLDDNWHPHHCGHRQGKHADVHVSHLPNQDRRDELKKIFKDYKFSVRGETDHWHVRILGGGNFDEVAGDSDLLASLNGTPFPLTRSAKPIVVSVSASVTYNQQTDRYTYAYKLRNLPTSSDTVDVFGLRQLLEPESISSPANWRGWIGWQDDSTSVMWMPASLGPPPAGWVDDSVNVYTSRFAILPGDSLAGFTIVSPNPPGQVQFLARKEGLILPLEEGDIDPPWWSLGVTGTTTGPVTPVGVPEQPAPGAPRGSLLRPAPNPFSRLTTLTFDIPELANVELNIYDPFGRRVAGVLHDQRPAGRHSISWNALSDRGERLPAGVYFVRFLVDGTPVNAKPLVVVN